MSVNRKGKITVEAVAKAVGFAALARSLDRIIQRSGKLAGMLEHQAFSLKKAEIATQGLITKYDLLAAANKGVALGVELNAESFAKLSRAAVVVSQKLGTDVNRAIEDLMVGMGRQSKMILDNLGIIVDTDSAYDQFARTLGKTASELSDMERRAAFQQEAIRQLGKIAGDAGVKVNNLGSQIQIAKNNIQDLVDNISGQWSDIIGTWMSNWNRDTVRQIIQYRILKGEIKETVANAQEAIKLGLFKGDVRRMFGHAGEVALGERRSTIEEFKGHQFGASGTAAGGAAGLSDRGSIGGVSTALTKGRRVKGAGRRFGRPDASFTELDEQQIQAAVRKTQAIREESAARLEQAMALAKANDLADKEAATLARVKRERDAVNAGIRAQIEAQNKLTAESAAINQRFTEFAEGGLRMFAQGLGDALFAVISGADSFAGAMQKMLTATLAAIAKEALVLSIMETGKGIAASILAPPLAAKHFAAAAVFASIGVGGAAISGAIGGGGSVGSGRSAARNEVRSQQSSSFGTRQRREKQTTVIKVFLDSSDRGSLLLARRNVSKQVDRQLTAEAA